MKPEFVSAILLTWLAVFAADAPPSNETPPNSDEKLVHKVETPDGKYRFSFDTTQAPDLTVWSDEQLVPMTREWYPKIVELLPSQGYKAPEEVTITFAAHGGGVAETSGTRIRCGAEWFRKNLKGEAKGAVFHELVHVVQNYGSARREHPDAPRPPGWLVEGIPDYLRWFIYEPESHGAEITEKNIARAKYDGNYRISANFLNWVTQKYDKKMVPEINAAIREGRYSYDLWKEKTGHDLQELGEEWRNEHLQRLAAQKKSEKQPASDK
jgi:hypothetical protein